MLFVFGSPRSGTTLLAQCLSAHSQILIPAETDFIVPLAFVVDRIADAAIGRPMLVKLITCSPGFRTSLGEHLSVAEVSQIVYGAPYRAADLVDTLYRQAAAKAGKQIGGDKSPNDLNFLRILVKTGVVGSQARIVHIVRDPRDALSSILEQGWAPGAEARFGRLWSFSNLYLQEICTAWPERYRVVRYEDFVHDPEPTLQAACALLEVAWEPAMLRPEGRHPRYRAMAQHQRLFQPFTEERIGSFRARLAPSVIATCEAQSVEAMRRFGYA